MYPALRFGNGHALYAVHTAFELQSGPDSICRDRRRLDGNGRVLVTAKIGLVGGQHLGLPAATFGVAQVHAQQVTGEQRGFLAALTALDLENDVLAVIRVTWG